MGYFAGLWPLLLSAQSMRGGALTGSVKDYNLSKEPTFAAFFKFLLVCFFLAFLPASSFAFFVPTPDSVTNETGD